jgi:hypothetical protein
MSGEAAIIILLGFGAPLLGLGLGAVTIILLIWALLKRRWLLATFVAAAAIAFPIALFITIEAGCARRCSDLEGQYYALFGALIASVTALLIAWAIARSNFTVRL